MLLLILASLGVLVAEDEVDLICQLEIVALGTKRRTLLVAPHLSGPNMMMYGEALENSSAWRAALSWRSFMYAPPHSRPSVLMLGFGSRLQVGSETYSEA